MSGGGCEELQTFGQSCGNVLSGCLDLQDDTIFSWYSGEGAARVADRWGGRVRRVLDGRAGLGRGSINVSAVRETDAGLYRCRVTFPNRTPPARNNGTFYYLEVDGQCSRSPQLRSDRAHPVHHVILEQHVVHFQEVT